MEPDIRVRRNQKEECWEVLVDFGIYGRLFHYKDDAEEYANKFKRDRHYLEGEVGHPAGLKKLERR